VAERSPHFHVPQWSCRIPDYSFRAIQFGGNSEPCRGNSCEVFLVTSNVPNCGAADDFSRRSFLVTVAGAVLGSFVLPPLPGRAIDGTRRELLVPPQGSPESVIVWIEIIDGEDEIMVWRPESPEELAEARRFCEAATRFDLDDPTTHVVEY
jgi:hypothetical protein